MRAVLRHRIRQLAHAEVGIGEAALDRVSHSRDVRLVGGCNAGGADAAGGPASASRRLENRSRSRRRDAIRLRTRTSSSRISNGFTMYSSAPRSSPSSRCSSSACAVSRMIGQEVRLGARAQHAHQLVPVGAGHHHVREHDVREVTARERDPLRAIRRLEHAEPRARSGRGCSRGGPRCRPPRGASGHPRSAHRRPHRLGRRFADVLGRTIAVDERSERPERRPSSGIVDAIGRRRAERNGRGERRPVAPALHRDRSAVQLHELLHQREPDPRTRLRAGRRLVHLVESLEDVRESDRAECPGRSRARRAAPILHPV